MIIDNQNLNFLSPRFGERGSLVVNALDSGSKGRGVQAPLGSNRVVSLSKAHLLPESTGNTQEAVAPSHYD